MSDEESRQEGTENSSASTVWKKNLYGRKNLSLHQEIIAEISENLYLRKGVVKEVVDEYLRILKREIIHRGNVVVKGLFTIKRGKKAAHKRRHIKTGEVVEHPESEHLIIALAQPLRDGFRRYHGYHGLAGRDASSRGSNVVTENIGGNENSGDAANNVGTDSVSKKREGKEDFNPFLDDDES